MQSLEIFECSACVLQLHIYLAELAHQQSGEVGDGKVGEEIDENYDLQRFQLGVRGRVRRNHQVVIEFEDTAEEDESEGGAEVSPDPWQKHAGDDDDQGVEKVQRTVDASGDMDHERDHGQIGEHLEDRLQAMLVPDRYQEKKKQRKHRPQHHTGKKRHDGKRAGCQANDG